MRLAGTDPALAQALCHVWITEGLYDKAFVEDRSTGFEEWQAYILGESDGVPKTPEWQEAETGVPTRDVCELARERGTKKTILGAMQGYGRSGYNFGNLHNLVRRSTSASTSRATVRAASPAT